MIERRYTCDLCSAKSLSESEIYKFHCTDSKLHLTLFDANSKFEICNMCWKKLEEYFTSKIKA
jgi:hypothetical protein